MCHAAWGCSSQAASGSINALSASQQQCLELLARARDHGKLQTELGSELKVPVQNFFHIVKGLEDRKLIVRNPIIIPKATNSRSTSIVHLTRFAQLHLRKGQSLWVQGAVGAHRDAGGERGGQVVVADDTAACQRVCEVLGEQEDGRMIVKFLKEAAGFVGKPGHRAWRKIKKQLIQNSMCGALWVGWCVFGGRMCCAAFKWSRDRHESKDTCRH